MLVTMREIDGKARLQWPVWRIPCPSFPIWLLNGVMASCTWSGSQSFLIWLRADPAPLLPVTHQWADLISPSPVFFHTSASPRSLPCGCESPVGVKRSKSLLSPYTQQSGAILSRVWWSLPLGSAQSNTDTYCLAIGITEVQPTAAFCWFSPGCLFLPVNCVVGCCGHSLHVPSLVAGGSGCIQGRAPPDTGFLLPTGMGSWGCSQGMRMVQLSPLPLITLSKILATSLT